MTPSVNIVLLPLESALLPLACLAVLWLLASLLFRRQQKRKDSMEMEEERNWGIPTIDSQTYLNSPFHDWDPRIKIVSLVLFIFCVASISQVFFAFVALLLAAVAAGAARIPFRRPLRRIRAMSFFLGMLILVMPLTVPLKAQDTLYIFDHLPFISFNSRGVALALSISLKALAIALMAEPLLATSKFSVTVQALARLRVPQMACQMILLAHRYIFVFQDESVRMKNGMKARGFHGRTDVETLRTIGNFLGMLLVRSFARTQKVYDAMLARGYTGSLPTGAEFCARRTDWVRGAFWTLLGVGLCVIDWYWKVSWII